MRSIGAVFAFLISFACLTAEAADLQILFIGNSHTAMNDQPLMFRDLALSGGHNVYVDQSTVGSSTLSYHSHYQTTLDLINERQWDHVVLQEHTLLLVIDYWRDTTFYPMAELLDGLIADRESNTVFYMHHAFLDAEGPYCIEEYCSRTFDGYADMQGEMANSHHVNAEALQADLIPAGEAWEYALEEDSSLNLWSFDDLHASEEGSYLNVCVFYAFFFAESPVGLDYHGGLREDRALLLQQLAADFIFAEPEPEPDPQPAATAYLRLLPNYPNPFNSLALIPFEIGAPAAVQADIFTVDGRRVSELCGGLPYPQGSHALSWDGCDDAGRPLPSGVYLFNLTAGAQSATGKLTLSK